MTKSDLNPKLLQIKKHFDKIEKIFNKLPNGMQDIILQQHNSDGSLNHCIRWGQQASEELCQISDKILKEYNENYD